jgi:hypothetical protein
VHRSIACAILMTSSPSFPVFRSSGSCPAVALAFPWRQLLPSEIANHKLALGLIRWNACFDYLALGAIIPPAAWICGYLSVLVNTSTCGYIYMLTRRSGGEILLSKQVIENLL